MPPVVIEVVAKTATVEGRTVNPVDLSPNDGARVIVVPAPGPQGPPGGGGSETVISTGTAGSALSGHRAVTLRPDSTIAYVSNDDLGDRDVPIWITTGAANTGASVQMVTFGPMTEPTWSWTPGRPIYLGTSGALTQATPAAPAAAFLAQLGTATTPTSLFVNRFPSIQLA